MGGSIKETLRGFSVRAYIAPGLRAHVGCFPTRCEAERAMETVEETGQLPDGCEPVFKHVSRDASGSYTYDYDGAVFGPFSTQLDAAHARRKAQDNEAQRARRAAFRAHYDCTGRRHRSEPPLQRRDAAPKPRLRRWEALPEPPPPTGYEDVVLIDFTKRTGFAPWLEL
jgi:hypothetical protein